MDSLSQLLRRYQRRPSQNLVSEILTALSQTQVYVPVRMEKNGDAAPEGDAYGLKPDTIPGPDNTLLYPAFSAQTQIADDYGAQFTFLHTPFLSFCAAACADPRFGGLVLDPFTAKFLIPEEIARKLFDISSGIQ